MEVCGTTINEVYNIMPINNIPSVIKHGILCHNNVSKMNHSSVASIIIQERRNKKIPNGDYLHDYANLYFDARNPMMYKVKNRDVCVLRISDDIFNLNDIIITDMNAASDYAKYLSVKDISQLNFELIFLKDWRSEDPLTYFRRKSAKCAEILVKKKVPPNMIIGAYVKNADDVIRLGNYGFNREILINKDIYFIGGA